LKLGGKSGKHARKLYLHVKSCFCLVVFFYSYTDIFLWYKRGHQDCQDSFSYLFRMHIGWRSFCGAGSNSNRHFFGGMNYVHQCLNY